VFKNSNTQDNVLLYIDVELQLRYRLIIANNSRLLRNLLGHAYTYDHFYLLQIVRVNYNWFAY